MKQTILVFFVAATLFGCDRSDGCRPNHKDIDYEVIESIELPTDGHQYSHVTPNVFETDSTTWIIGLDTDNPGIDFYSLENKKFLKRIALPHEGPNQIIAPCALLFRNIDSIFILNDLNHLYLLAADGRKIGEWDFRFDLPDSILKIDPSITGEFIIAAYGKSEFLNLPFFYIPQSKSILARIFILNNLEGSARYGLWYKTPTLIQIDLPTNSVKGLFGKYPSAYKQTPRPHNPFAHFVYFNGNNLLQFDADNLLYSCERDTFFCAASSYFKNNITKFNSNEVPEEQELRAYHTDDAYLGIYHDPYNNVIYRVFQHSQPDKDVENKLNQKLQAEFSIMVLSEDGDVLGEARFDKSIYNFLDVFVTKRGILISKENSHNPKNEEDFYSFDLIKLKI